MANNESWKNRHTWANKSFGRRLAAFVQSDQKMDGSGDYHPAKVSLKGSYTAKNGDVINSYVDIPAYAIPDMIETLKQAQEVNEKYFKGQVNTEGPGIRTPPSFTKKTK